MNLIDANTETLPSRHEEVRNRHGPHERRVRSVELLFWSVAGYCLMSAICLPPLLWSFSAPDERNSTLFIGAAVVFVLIGVPPALAAWNIRRLSTAGQVLGVIVACCALLAFPVGTLVGGLALWILLGKEGKAVFSDSYRAALSATPNLQFRVSKVVVGIVVAFLVLMGGGAIATSVFLAEPTSTELQTSKLGALAQTKTAAELAPSSETLDAVELAREPGLPGAKVIRFALLVGEVSLVSNAITDWGRELEQQSGGRLEIESYAGGVQGDDLEVLQKIREGTLEAAIVTNRGLDIIARPELLALSSPGISADYEQFQRVVQSIEEPLTRRLDRAGVVVLGWQWTGGKRIFSSRTFRRPGDLEDRQPWLWNHDPALEQYLQAVGATPVRGVQRFQVREAAVQGKIDTIVGTPIEALAFQWHFPMSYVSKQSFGPSVSAILIRKETFAELSTGDQRLLVDSARRISKRIEELYLDFDAKAYEGVLKRLEEIDLSAHRDEWDAVAQRALELTPGVGDRVVSSDDAQQAQRIPFTGGQFANAQYDFSKETDAALAWFKNAVDLDSPNAQYNLGVMYEHGLGLPQDLDKAANRYRSAAENGFAPAQDNLGVLYEHGRGVPQDHAKAVQWYREASKKGFARAQFHLASAFSAGLGVPEDHAKAASWCRKAARQGFVLAQFNLGTMYLTGQGVPRDADEGLKWYGKAAKQGLVQAQHNLGVYYEDGVGVPQNRATAADWYRKAAEQGFTPSQHNLATMYEDGRGVPQDDGEAAHWFQKAAEQGFALAQYNLGVLYDEGRGVPQVDAKALYWYRMAAQQGLADAQNSLGVLYAGGRGVAKDENRALALYREAEAQGNGPSRYNLGRAFAKGDSVPRDDVKAAEFYRLAANQGVAEAQLELGAAYAEGRGVPRDRDEAERWFRAAAQQGNSKAIAALRQFGQ